MDWDNITQAIFEASSATLAELAKEIGNDTLYVFCLYTDSDGGSVVPSANTEEAYKAALAKAGDCSDGYKRALRWTPEEMTYCEFGGDRFNTVSRTLFASTDLDHTADAMIRALGRLRDEEAYRRLAEPPILFVSVSDDDRARSLEERSARALNDPERTATFLGR